MDAAIFECQRFPLVSDGGRTTLTMPVSMQTLTVLVWSLAILYPTESRHTPTDRQPQSHFLAALRHIAHLVQEKIGVSVAPSSVSLLSLSLSSSSSSSSLDGGSIPTTAVVVVTPKDLSMVVWAFAKLGFRHEGLLQDIVEASLRQMASFASSDLNNLAWGLSTLMAHVPAILSAPIATPFSASLCGLVRPAPCPVGRAARAAHAAIHCPGGGADDADDVASHLSSAPLSPLSLDALFSAMARRAVEIMTDFDYVSLANLAWALAVFDYRGRSTCIGRGGNVGGGGADDDDNSTKDDADEQTWECDEECVGVLQRIVDHANTLALIRPRHDDGTPLLPLSPVSPPSSSTLALASGIPLSPLSPLSSSISALTNRPLSPSSPLLALSPRPLPLTTPPQQPCLEALSATQKLMFFELWLRTCRLSVVTRLGVSSKMETTLPSLSPSTLSLFSSPSSSATLSSAAAAVANGETRLCASPT
jgi:hypothetical protein